MRTARIVEGGSVQSLTSGGVRQGVGARGDARNLRERSVPHHRSVMSSAVSSGPPSTVLVVDDEQIVREVVARYLRRDGYRTLEAGDGVAARDLIERDAPALIVLDLMLPGIDGLELCRWIRARSETPVIMLTARGRGGRPHRRPRARRRRLRHQALLAARAGGARARPCCAASPAGAHRRERLSVGDLVIDHGAREVTLRRRARPPDRQGVRPALVPGQQPAAWSSRAIS